MGWRPYPTLKWANWKYGLFTHWKISWRHFIAGLRSIFYRYPDVDDDEE